MRAQAASATPTTNGADTLMNDAQIRANFVMENSSMRNEVRVRRKRADLATPGNQRVNGGEYQ